MVFSGLSFRGLKELTILKAVIVVIVVYKMIFMCATNVFFYGQLKRSKWSFNEISKCSLDTFNGGRFIIQELFTWERPSSPSELKFSI